jgi:hypothetical protein
MPRTRIAMSSFVYFVTLAAMTSTPAAGLFLVTPLHVLNYL